jgi:hypothetical protein
MVASPWTSPRIGERISCNSNSRKLGATASQETKWFVPGIGVLELKFPNPQDGAIAKTTWTSLATGSHKLTWASPQDGTRIPPVLSSQLTGTRTLVSPSLLDGTRIRLVLSSQPDGELARIPDVPLPTGDLDADLDVDPDVDRALPKLLLPKRVALCHA